MPFASTSAACARVAPCVWMVTLLASATACATGGVPIEIRLEGRVGERAFACGSEYGGIGTTGTTYTALGLRFYVHDVRVTTATGVHDVTLTNDGTWQNDGVALVDFEDGNGCEGGDPATNRVLRGTVPVAAATVTGLRFRIGVPEARNYVNADTEPPPLDKVQMFWGWESGYRHLRIDGRSTGLPDGVGFHLGSTDCQGDPRRGERACANGNRPEIVLDGFDATRSVVLADLATLFASSDLDVNANGLPGCRSDEDDLECPPLFESIGLGTGGAQRFFRLATTTGD